MAGAPGFEPGITGPKPVALPLGYAPKLERATDGAILDGRPASQATPQRLSPNRSTSATRARIPTAINARVPTRMTRIGTSATSACDTAAVQRASRATPDRSRDPITKEPAMNSSAKKNNDARAIQ